MFYLVNAFCSNQLGLRNRDVFFNQECIKLLSLHINFDTLYFNLAGMAQTWLCSPMELVKIRMQSQGEGEKQGSQRVYSSAFDCLKKI